ncbi:MAG: arylsulfatase [Planctomycetes bacterium]|nr:arylsulfatase [Planctomycetota bacterium]
MTDATTNSATQPARPRPNIVLLYADDMGYGDLAIQNPESKLATPALDRLAREGTRFTNAHSSSGICTPSRYALLTGRYHWRKFHEIVNSWGPSVIDAARVTLPEMLRNAGYRTACIGKWHLGWDWSAIRKRGCDTKELRNRADSYDWSAPIPDGPVAHGFDTYFGDDVPNFPPYTFIENDRVVAAPDRPHVPNPKPDEGSPECRPGPMAPGWRLDRVMPTLTDRAVRWIEQCDTSKPFFLYFPFTSPHAPIVPTEEFRGSSRAGPYGDFVQQTDATVGRVLAALEGRGLTNDTIVIFTSDNGPERYAYARASKYGHRSMGPLRGLKRDVYEGGHRVPFVVRWPRVVAAGRVTDELIGQIDIMATLASALGVEVPEGMAEDSRDQFPLWRNVNHSMRSVLVHNTYAKVYGIRMGPWLLIDGPTGQHSKAPADFLRENGYVMEEPPPAVQLFDLATDLPQRHNVAGEHPAEVEMLKTLLTTVREQSSIPR